MPESKSRKNRTKRKSVHVTTPTSKSPTPADAVESEYVPSGGNSPWLVPSMLTLMIAGLAWIVVFYLSGSHQYPVPAWGVWNIAAGFALIVAGFSLTTRWK